MKRNHNILGVESSEIKSDFDPLLPLQECLERDPSSSTASALAPLCISLGVPNGYINARALIERIKRAKRLGHKLPCYENEVLPAVKRLKTPKDGADLAEWCAMQYKCDSVNRLNCLELALNLAVRVSTEAELKRSKKSMAEEGDLIYNETKALERVKRLTSRKSALSDMIIVRRILKREIKKTSSVSSHRIISTIVEKVLSSNSDSEELLPEEFVKSLFQQGSLLTSEACLNRSICLSVEDFGFISQAVYKACKCLANQYSHIKIGNISRMLVWRWLVHGDHDTPGRLGDKKNRREDASPKKLLNTMEETMSIDEDDTVNFILDLNAFGTGNDEWSYDVRSEVIEEEPKKITVNEELSTLKSSSSSRERSEFQSVMAGLRVAFVMAHTIEFHSAVENIDRNEYHQ